MFTVTFNNTFIHFFCLSFQLFQKILKLHTSFFFFYSVTRTVIFGTLHFPYFTVRHSPSVRVTVAAALTVTGKVISASESPAGRLMMVASPSRLQILCCMAVRMTGTGVQSADVPSMAARAWATFRRTSVFMSDHFFFTSGSSRGQVVTWFTFFRMSIHALFLAMCVTPALKWLTSVCFCFSISSTIISTSLSEKFIFLFLATDAISAEKRLYGR